MNRAHLSRLIGLAALCASTTLLPSIAPASAQNTASDGATTTTTRDDDNNNWSWLGLLGLLGLAGLAGKDRKDSTVHYRDPNVTSGTEYRR
ncbi:MAG TPA: WGxxGxxG family protein [Stenomitos sp.]